MEINIQNDLTKHYLEQVIKGKAPQLSELSDIFQTINIDRVIQGFVDSIIEPDKCKNDPQAAIFMAGQLDMAQKIKVLFANLSRISDEINLEGDASTYTEDVLELVKGNYMSQKDIDLLNADKED